MPDKQEDLEQLLDSAREKEKRFDWSGAAHDYERALSLVPESDAWKKGQVSEEWAFALQRKAFQADSFERFKEELGVAIARYEDTMSMYLGISTQEASPWDNRCKGMTAFLRYWLSQEVVLKKKLLEESWNHARTAMKEFEGRDLGLEFWRTFDCLSSAPAIAHNYDTDPDSRKGRARDAIECAEKAAMFASETKDPAAQARTYARLAAFKSIIATDFTELGRQRILDRETYDLWMRARDIDEEAALLEIPFWGMYGGMPYACTREERVATYAKAPEVCLKTGDNWHMGWGYERSANIMESRLWFTEDPDRAEELSIEILGQYKKADDSFSRIGFLPSTIETIWVKLPELGLYCDLAELDSEPHRRRKLAEKAYDLARRNMGLAEQSGYPDLYSTFRRNYAYALGHLAKTEADNEKKREYLADMISTLRSALDEFRRLHPNIYPYHVVFLQGLSEAEYSLSENAVDEKGRLDALRRAIQLLKECAEMADKDIWPSARSDSFVSLAFGINYHRYGRRATELYELTKDRKILQEIVVAFDKAIGWFKTGGTPIRIAESYWGAGQALDLMGEYAKSSETYAMASNHYKKAAENLPRIRELYDELSAYMQAWSEIELARHCHSKQDSGGAKEHYEKAAVLHKSTKKWIYLADNYSAWAQIENAEDQSRKEMSQEALGAFEKASNLFEEASHAIQSQIDKIEQQDEKKMAARLLDAAASRRGYCLARMALEEARILDKKGEEFAASEKYARAAGIFQEIHDRLTSEQDRAEIQLIIYLSRAWHMVSKAEAEASPELYAEASALFDQAKTLGFGEKSKLLISGHSRLCKALEAGAMFADSGDISFHDKATQHLESAAKYYVRAGDEKASSSALATKLLLDAYMHMDEASKEKNHEKKAKSYALAEKVLQASASHYEKAGQLGKRNDVLGLLEKVKEEHQLTVSLIEVMRAPDAVSSPAAFSSPTQTHESAVGLDRFDHADVQATLYAKPKEIHVGEELSLEIELVNAGRGTAQLTKVEKIVPEGFEVVKEPENYRIEDSYVNFKGKRLDALKTENVRVVMKPTAHGRFVLRPRILYIDESGYYKLHELEPVEIVVRELGISGWLKGPEKKKQAV